MLCPNCQSDSSRVLESRTTADKTSIRRRRECENCQQRFTTYEKIEFTPIIILKKNGARDEYCRLKLSDSIANSSNKCGITCETIEKIVNKIESDLTLLAKKEVTSNFLGEKVLEKLILVNEMAYVRYLLAFKHFNNLSELLTEIKNKIKSTQSKIKIN